MYNVWAMASRAGDWYLPFRLALSQSFCVLFLSYFSKAKSKDLAVLANTPKPLNKALTALFAIAIVVQSFLFGIIENPV